jgi:hypothetical protein
MAGAVIKVGERVTQPPRGERKKPLLGNLRLIIKRRLPSRPAAKGSSSGREPGEHDSHRIYSGSAGVPPA